MTDPDDQLGVGAASVHVGICRVRPEAEDLELPSYATSGSSGLDLRACLPLQERPLILEPGSRHSVPTGVALGLPYGVEGQVRPRSGLALRHGITCLNAPGTIDSDYRGEICVILANLGHEPFAVDHGDRIAQLVIAPVVRAVLVPVDALPATDRGTGGFGSTGVR